MSDCKIVEMLEKIEVTLNSVIPRIDVIEKRLDKLDTSFNTELGEIKSSTSDLLLEVRGSVRSLGSLPRTSCSSDSLSQTTSDPPSGLDLDVPDPSFQGDRLGVVISDVDESEMAANIGQLLNCQVTPLSYSAVAAEASLFEKELEFVVIQDSGSMLDKYNEVTTEIVQEITAYVQNLVNVASNILQLKPRTKVFLGSLPPRFDGRQREGLARVFNGLLVTESFIYDNIVVVSQSSLHTRDQRKLFERYEEDLVMLTKYGRTLRMKNTAHQVAQAVPGLSVLRKKKHHPQQHFKPNRGWWGGRNPSNYELKSVLSNFLRSL